MILTFGIVFCIVVALGFGLLAALSDIQTLSIPNSYSIAIILSFLIAFLLSQFSPSEASIFQSWKSHLIAGVFVFLVTYALFFFKMMGGGDSKLLSSYGLWIGLEGFMPLFFMMTIAGCVMGVFTLILNKKTIVQSPREGGWIAVAQSGGKKVPYAVAIAAGAMFAFVHNGFLSPDAFVAMINGGAS